VIRRYPKAPKQFFASAHFGFLRICCLVLIACGRPEPTWFTENRDIGVFRVIAPTPINVGKPEDATMAVYAMYLNRGATADTLIGVESPAARSATVHVTVKREGTMTMAPAANYPAPPGMVESMTPGATHVMLEGLTRLFLPGDSVPVTFVFKRSGKVATHAKVVGYEELEKIFPRPRSAP
jgi:copper(I)-binding protein